MIASILMAGAKIHGLAIIMLIAAFLVIGLISKTKGFKIGNGILCAAYLAVWIYMLRPSVTSFQINYLNIYIMLPVLQFTTAIYVIYATLISKHVAILYNEKGDVSVFRKMLFKVFLAFFVVVVVILTLNDLQIIAII